MGSQRVGYDWATESNKKVTDLEDKIMETIQSEQHKEKQI